ncbi:MAG: MazG-like family protein [Cellvibrionaceae bacterium]
MSDLDKITQQLIKFRDEREWAQFHDSKNLALALLLEASELNELFLWKQSEEQVESVDKQRLAEELADVMAYALLLAEKHNLDITTILEEKIQQNQQKYPVDKAKGSSKKYNEL